MILDYPWSTPAKSVPEVWENGTRWIPYWGERITPMVAKLRQAKGQNCYPAYRVRYVPSKDKNLALFGRL